MVPEPRRIAGLDADGDGGRDLAMISQDRLVIYLSAEDRPEDHGHPENEDSIGEHDRTDEQGEAGR
jgi:hypothetical protein